MENMSNDFITHQIGKSAQWLTRSQERLDAAKAFAVADKRYMWVVEFTYVGGKRSVHVRCSDSLESFNENIGVCDDVMHTTSALFEWDLGIERIERTLQET